MKSFQLVFTYEDDVTVFLTPVPVTEEIADIRIHMREVPVRPAPLRTITVEFR